MDKKLKVRVLPKEGEPPAKAGIESTDEQAQTDKDTAPEETWFLYEVTGEKPRPDDCPVVFSQKAYKKIIAHLSADTSREHGGLLLGYEGPAPHLVEKAVWVIDVLQAEHTRGSVSRLTFTEDTWAEFDNQTEQLRQDGSQLKRIGWYHSHPNFGIFLSAYDLDVCTAFSGQKQIALVYDPIRHEGGFFINGTRGYDSRKPQGFCEWCDDEERPRSIVDWKNIKLIARGRTLVFTEELAEQEEVVIAEETASQVDSVATAETVEPENLITQEEPRHVVKVLPPPEEQGNGDKVEVGDELEVGPEPGSVEQATGPEPVYVEQISADGQKIAPAKEKKRKFPILSTLLGIGAMILDATRRNKRTTRIIVLALLLCPVLIATLIILNRAPHRHSGTNATGEAQVEVKPTVNPQQAESPPAIEPTPAEEVADTPSEQAETSATPEQKRQATGDFMSKAGKNIPSNSKKQAENVKKTGSENRSKTTNVNTNSVEPSPSQPAQAQQGNNTATPSQSPAKPSPSIPRTDTLARPDSSPARPQ